MLYIDALLPFFSILFASEKGNEISGNKKEEREDHIVKMESVPWHMIELPCPPLKKRPASNSRE